MFLKTEGMILAEHGGNIDEAAKRYGVNADEMYDLSTGISPIAYDCPLPSSAAYQALPLETEIAWVVIDVY